MPRTPPPGGGVSRVPELPLTSSADSLMVMPQAAALLAADDLVISHLSPGFAQVCGEPPEQLIGQPILNVAGLLGHTAGNLGIRQMVERRGIVVLTNVSARDGTLHCLLVVPLQSVGGGLDLLVLFLDGGPPPDERIERAEAERELMRLSERQAHACSQFPLDLALLDGKGEVVAYNLSVLRFLRDTDSPRPAMPTLWHTSGGLCHSDEHPVARALQGQLVSGQEVCIRTAEAICYAAIGALPLLDGEGKPGRVLVALRDLTESRLAQRRLTRAVEAERRRTGEIRAVYAVSQVLSQTLELNECLDVVASSLVEAAGADRCAIMLQSGDRLTFAAGCGRNGEPPHALEEFGCEVEQAAGSHLRTAVQTCRSVVIQDAENDPVLGPFARKQGLHSLLIVPLVNGGTVLGVAYLDRRGKRRMFFHSQVRLASAIATQGAAAIERARLYHSEHERSQLLETMISELNHRVKNNLAIVAGLVSLQLLDPRLSRESKALLRNTVTRIQSIAVIHQLLYEEDVRMVEMRETIQRIALVVGQALSPEGNIDCHVDGDSLMLPSKLATSLGVVVNELLCNAIRHGLEGCNGGKVTASLHVGDEVELTVTDNGRGLPPDFGEGHMRTGGMIVRGLVERELRGTFTIGNRPEGGTIARVSFRRERVEEAIAEQALVERIPRRKIPPSEQSG